MKKTIVVISNPFGYGPTGKALSVVNSLKELRLQDTNIVFVGDQFCLEIAKNNEIQVIQADVRSEVDLERVFSSLENPHVLSFQNRFGIKVAKQLGLPSAFIDGLVWMWDPIPADHLIADIIFWTKMPWFSPTVKNNIKLINPIIGKLTRSNAKRSNQIMIYIGGVINPLVKEISEEYLKIIGELINRIDENSSKILVVTSEDVKNHLAKYVTNPNADILHLNKNDFLLEIKKSQVFISNGGQNGFLEAVGLGVPTGFILPYNKSQHFLVDHLLRSEVIKDASLWSIDNYQEIDEKEYIQRQNSQSRELLVNEENLTKTLNQELEIIKNPESINLAVFFKDLEDGSVQIANELKTKWNLK